MTPEEVLSHPARVLTQAQREHYFEHGYVGVEDLVTGETLADLQRVTDEFFNASRQVTASDDTFDISPDHTAENPVLRRLKTPDEKHKTYWDFSTGLMADVAADLVGPNVTFHHSKLNFKWYDESDTVKWHQ
ncbi:MAG: phytanoyl-CoA dioxygenase family protein, partial [Pseudomonadota bacterium]